MHLNLIHFAKIFNISISLFFLSIESSSQVGCIGVSSVLIFQWLHCHYFLRLWHWCCLSFSEGFWISTLLSEGISSTGSSWNDFNANMWIGFGWLKFVLWCSSSSEHWDLSNILIHKMVDIWSDIFGVSNILLFGKMLECWVQASIKKMWLFFSFVWSWEHVLIIGSHSVNFWVNILVADISFVLLS